MIEKHQPGDRLGIEVRRFLGHPDAGADRLADTGDWNGIEEEDELGVPGGERYKGNLYRITHGR